MYELGGRVYKSMAHAKAAAKLRGLSDSDIREIPVVDNDTKQKVDSGDPLLTLISDYVKSIDLADDRIKHIRNTWINFEQEVLKEVISRIPDRESRDFLKGYSLSYRRWAGINKMQEMKK